MAEGTRRVKKLRARVARNQIEAMDSQHWISRLAAAKRYYAAQLGRIDGEDGISCLSCSSSSLRRAPRERSWC